jgi:hypothetical protein
MSEGPQYTSCVEKENWVSVMATVGVADVAAAVAAILAVIAGAPAAGVILGFAAGAEIIHKVAGWLLNGKLICLKNVQRRVFQDPDPDRVCVLGTILDFEKVGEDKSGFDNIDNDFGVNLFLAPFPIGDVSTMDPAVLKLAMENSAQGDLIQNPDAPAPPAGAGPLKRKDDPTKNFGPMPVGFTGYERGLKFSAKFPKPIPANVYDDPHELAKVDPKFAQIRDDAYAEFVSEFAGTVVVNGQVLSDAEKKAILDAAAKDPLSESRVVAKFYASVDAAFGFVLKNAPALHCEFEGSRIRDVYNVLDFAHVHCDTSGFWGFLCDVLNIVISIFLGIPKLIAAAVAWAAADDGNLSDAYDGTGGELTFGDPIVVRGRWVYDSAHSGYNEMHAVRTVHKTLPAPQDPVAFLAFHETWCSELGKVPPSPPPTRDPHAPPDGPMTPAQHDTKDGQERDENRWVYHPAIDGCIPPQPPAPDPH